MRMPWRHRAAWGGEGVGAGRRWWLQAHRSASRAAETPAAGCGWPWCSVLLCAGQGEAWGEEGVGLGGAPRLAKRGDHSAPLRAKGVLLRRRRHHQPRTKATGHWRDRKGKTTGCCHALLTQVCWDASSPRHCGPHKSTCARPPLPHSIVPHCSTGSRRAEPARPQFHHLYHRTDTTESEARDTRACDEDGGSTRRWAASAGAEGARR